MKESELTLVVIAEKYKPEEKNSKLVISY